MAVTGGPVPGWTFRGWMGMMLRYETKEQP
jgi:hypothetical protein